MPTSRHGARTPSATFVKTRGDRESPKGKKSVSRKDRDIKVSILQVDHCTPILGLDASVNGWIKPLTVLPNSPNWEMGASRERALLTSFISARLSQRWHSWTTRVDIAFSRDSAVTFVTRKPVPSHGLVLPSCICFSALAWCRIVMHARQRCSAVSKVKTQLSIKPLPIFHYIRSMFS